MQALGWKDRGTSDSTYSGTKKGLLIAANRNEVSGRKTPPWGLYLDWSVMCMTRWLETHRALLPSGTPGREDSLTLGCGAWLGSAVNLPPTETHTDLTGLMVWDPGL